MLENKTEQTAEALSSRVVTVHLKDQVCTVTARPRELVIRSPDGALRFVPLAARRQSGGGSEVQQLQKILALYELLGGQAALAAESQHEWEQLARELHEAARHMEAALAALVENGVLRQTATAQAVPALTAPAPGVLAPRENARPCAIVSHISAWAYLRSVWAMIWGALRHPRSTTVVDLSTGKAVHVPARG